MSLFLSLVLVAPVVWFHQASPVGSGPNDRPVVLRACVEQGTHGSVANLSQIVVVSPGRELNEPGRIMYWFHKNVAGFRDEAGHLVEISGTIAEVLTGNPELRATDGVFAEAHVSPGDKETAVATTGTVPERASTPDGAVALEADQQPLTVIKAAVDRIRTLGTCR